MSPVSVRFEFDLPEIQDDDSFRQVANKLSVCVSPPPPTSHDMPADLVTVTS